ncbi:MAG TPA: hypothetical protein VFS23_39810, partial [Vicinamibacterales bacterium]|nr:hypothetical protein [Vicinamibacterales bacterium]
MVRTRVLPLLGLLLLTACSDSNDGNDGSGNPDPPDPVRGDLIGEATFVASYSPDELLALAGAGDLTELLLEEVLTPDCAIDVYHYEYQTVDPAGDITPASAALMVPNDAATACQGERPIALYAHGTNTDEAFDIADLENNSEGLFVAAVLAAEGYIVVAPNYVGYDSSTLDYHPYLNGDQQSKDMIDALAAARSSLPAPDSSDTTDDGRLFITGYS